MKKLLVLLLTAVMLFAAAACANDSDVISRPTGDLPVPGEELTGELNIFLNKQGYGEDWLQALKREFESIHPKLEINIFPIVENAPGANDIENGNGDYDLVFSGSSLAKYGMPDIKGKTKLLDLTDVANAIPEGETRSAAEKMAVNSVNDLFIINGKYYALPWMSTFGGLHYNIKVLDTVFGEGKWQEPATTNEFISMLNELETIESKKSADTRAYGITVCKTLAYWGYPADTWWAQYEGQKEFQNFHYAEFYDENGVKQVAKNAEEFSKAMNPAGRLKALEVVQAALRAKNINPVSADIGFEDHQKQFATGIYQKNRNPSAFITCGDWFELETRSAVMQAGQPVRMMRTPMLSSIAERLNNSAMDDATLAKIVRAIDRGAFSAADVAASAAVTVSEEDFQRIYEARRTITYQSGNHVVGIPASARNIPAAKAFLVFMASNYGQQVFAKATGGLTPPYDYDVTSDESIVLSEYVKSLNKAYGGSFKYLPAAADIKAPLVMYGGLDNFGNLNNMDSQFYAGANAAGYNNWILSELTKKYSTNQKFISPTVRGQS